MADSGMAMTAVFSDYQKRGRTSGKEKSAAMCSTILRTEKRSEIRAGAQQISGNVLLRSQPDKIETPLYISFRRG